MKHKGFGWNHRSASALKMSDFKLLPEFSSFIVSASTPTTIWGSTQEASDWTMFKKLRTLCTARTKQIYCLRNVPAHTASHIIAHRTPAACTCRPMKRKMNRLSIKKHTERDNIQLLGAAKGGSITQV